MSYHLVMAEHALTHTWNANSAAALVAPEDPRDAWSETTRRMVLGDASAFQSFYDVYFPIMLQTARRATGRDEHTCLDIVQDAMLKAMRGMKPIPNQQQLNAFVRVLTQRVAIDWLRQEGRQTQLRKKIASSQELVAETDPIDDVARIAWLESQLNEMDSELRRLLDFRYRMGWTLQTIATKLGMKTGAVDGRIRRAVERLRILSEEEFNESA
jgi:RNA polymerase sigma factor (sigma-70 family)